MDAGIDYGRGMTNIDNKTGIRYGVINQHEVLQVWADSSEANYGKPEEAECPECGTPFICKKKTEWGDEIECVKCGEMFTIEIPDGYEPLSFYIDDQKYSAECGEDGDIFITKSPYYTYARFCSPCAPGAGYLMNASEYGVKTYCFGHSWFEETETEKMIDCRYCHGTGLRMKSEFAPGVLSHLESFDDHRVKCHVCIEGWKTGSQGKVKEMIQKAPYPVFSVETGELVNP